MSARTLTEGGSDSPHGEKRPAATAAAPAIIIRDIRRLDRPAVDRLVRGIELFSEAEKAIAMEVIDAYLNDPGKDYHALGAFTPRGTLLGYTCYGPTPCTSGTWDLYWIAVSGEARGRGIGTLLMEEVEGKLVHQDARLLLIETSSRADYAPTRGFYERRGYAVVARVQDFYDVGDDRLIFARTMNRV